MVENSLDATEAIKILPNIDVTVYNYNINSEELTIEQFNELRGIKTRNRTDESLYALPINSNHSPFEEKKNRNEINYYRV